MYRRSYANIHRGVHTLSVEATDAYEQAREKVRAFVNAAETGEIVFVRGTTEAINLVAQTFGRQRVGEGDEVVVTALEHHSNIVPWQLLCDEKKARLKVLPIDRTGEVRVEELERLLTPRSRVVSIAHVSNALGTLVPVRRIVEIAHARGVPVLVDGAQAVRGSPSTSASSAATSTRFLRTRCTARRGWASSTGGRSCSTPCRPTRAAAT
jgi:cysteine desulfurase/selenocysteine lyase